jgi:prolyl oligopeptidase
MLGSAVTLGAQSVQTKANTAEGATDPYLWLEDVHGDKPMEWVKAQNAKATAVLQADPDYARDYAAILKVMDATDRIPYGDLDHQYVTNFWQDAQHPKGIWRRTDSAEYAKTDPKWDILLDLDKLAADEHENWVWKGAECSPALKRCLLALSRGGGDAVVVREFDLTTRAFLKDGFQLPEAKSSTTYLDEDSVLFGTDFGAGAMTTSGTHASRTAERGEPLAVARISSRARRGVASQGAVFHTPRG